MPPAEKLRHWFIEEGRKLPWRESPTPYRVWVSEVMLQQTQVATVIPYYKRWMMLFPSLKELALAPFEDVIKAWEGLGYYSRARNLHAGANYFLSHCSGEIPDDPLLLSKVKGLGPYTVAAILAFGFHRKVAAVDGNILRVLSRFYAIEAPIDTQKTRKLIQKFAEEFLPDERPWQINEALIELGATVCQKVPQCLTCPLKSECLAFRENRQRELPVKKNKITITPLYRLVAVVFSSNKVLVKRGEQKLMKELYEFPFINVENRSFSSDEVTALFERELSIKLTYVRSLSPQSHSFTRYRATLFPILFSTKEELGVELEKIPTLPFSAGHRRILRELKI